MTTPMLTISNLQVTDILYYDEAFRHACYRFCEQRDIDYLPSVEDDGFVYQVDSDTKSFLKIQILDTQRVDTHEEIFHPKLLARFNTFGVLFVYENHNLVGVVHFSDYNKDIVRIYVYSLIIEYERLLRILLSKDYQNANMVDFLRAKKKQNKIREYEKRETQADRLPPFHLFYLSDLIEFANENGVFNTNPHINVLRNKIMHAQELVEMKDFKTDDYIYDYRTFELFFRQVTVLKHDLKRVRNRLHLRDELSE